MLRTDGDAITAVLTTHGWITLDADTQWATFDDSIVYGDTDTGDEYTQAEFPALIINDDNDWSHTVIRANAILGYKTTGTSRAKAKQDAAERKADNTP